MPMRHFQSASHQMLYEEIRKTILPARVAQSVTCLATDAKLTADPGS